MCYPTPNKLIILAQAAANDSNLPPDSRIEIWDRGGVVITLCRSGWNYSAQLQCDGIRSGSGMPILVCNAGQWQKDKHARRNTDSWLQLVISRRFEKLIEAEQLEL